MIIAMSFACESVVVEWGKASVSQSQILEGAADQLTLYQNWLDRKVAIDIRVLFSCYFVILFSAQNK